jgi:hypothetical protein
MAGKGEAAGAIVGFGGKTSPPGSLRSMMNDAAGVTPAVPSYSEGKTVFARQYQG